MLKFEDFVVSFVVFSFSPFVFFLKTKKKCFVVLIVRECPINVRRNSNKRMVRFELTLIFFFFFCYVDRVCFFSSYERCTYLAVVQSRYKMSKSLQDNSLQRLTPGWIAPNPRRIRTCSTLQTNGTISNLFSFV